MPARGQSHEQRASEPLKSGRTAAVRRRPSATDPGIRDGPFPQGAGSATEGAQTARARGKEESNGSKKKGRSSSSEETVESYSSDEGLGKEDESKVRRTAATKPGALLHSGLVMMQRHLGRQVEDFGAVDAVQAKGLAAAYLATALKPNAGSKLSFAALRELQSLGEAVDLLMRARVASAGDVLIQRFRAVEAASLEEGGLSVARHLEVLPEATVSTMSSGLWGLVMKTERARLRLRQVQWKRSPREEKEGPFARDQRWRSAAKKKKNLVQIGKEAGRTEDGGGPTPRGINSGTTRSELVRNDRARESEPCNRGRRSGSIGGVRGPEGLIVRRVPGQRLACPAASHGALAGWGNPFKAGTRTEQSCAAVVLRCREYLRSPSAKVGAESIPRTSWEEVLLPLFVGRSVSCRRNSQGNGRRAKSQGPG